jgi:PST family polysaccharide transporter
MTEAARDDEGQPRPSIGDAAALGLLSSGAAVVLGIARSKVTALVLGPSGVGVSSEILQVVALAQTPVAIFTGTALLGRLARARADDDHAAIDRAYDASWTLAAVTALVCSVCGTLASLWVLPSTWARSVFLLTVLGAAGAAITALAGIVNQTLVAFERLRVLAWIGVATAGVQTTLVVTGTWLWGLRGQFVALAIAPLLAFGFALRAAARRGPRRRWLPRLSFDRDFAREATALGTTSLVAAAGLQLSLLVIRVELDKRGGPALTGQFQAAWAIGSGYFGFVLGSLGNYSFPRFAAAKDAESLAAEVDHATAFVLRIAPPLVLMMIALREPIVRALYSHRFDEAVPLMGIMMAGDLARAVLWAVHGPMLLRGQLRAYLLVELLGVAVLGLGSALLIPRFGVRGPGIAYVGTYVALAPFAALVLRRSTGARVHARPIWMAVAMSLALAGSSLLGEGLWTRLALLTAAIVWGAVGGLFRAVASRVRGKLRGISLARADR